MFRCCCGHLISQVRVKYYQTIDNILTSNFIQVLQYFVILPHAFWSTNAFSLHLSEIKQLFLQIYKRHFGSFRCMCFAVFRLNLQKLVCVLVCLLLLFDSFNVKRGRGNAHCTCNFGQTTKTTKRLQISKFFAEHTISFLIQNKTLSMAVLLGAALQPPEYFDSLWLGSGSRCDQRLWHMFCYKIVLCC